MPEHSGTRNSGATASTASNEGAFRIRDVRAPDMGFVVDLDRRVTGLAKQDYWDGLYQHFAEGPPTQTYFLVAEADRGEAQRLIGFITGEVRAFEFGSSPCGWVFAISVDPEARLDGVGSALMDAISEKFRAAGVKKMRTMISRHNHLLMSFFRSHGMMAGPYIQFEKDLDE